MQLETFFSISHQAGLFLMSVLLGAILGVVYDVFRAFRIVFPPARKSGAVFVQDILFWIIYGAAVFCYSTLAARGEIRFFVFLGSLAGFVLYILTIGNFIIGVLRWIFDAFYGVLRKVYSVTIEPIVNLLRRKCQKAVGVFVGSNENRGNNKRSGKKHLKNRLGLVYNKKAKLGSSMLRKKIGGDRIE